ncbi:MAG: TIGR04086 family membrane protein, partial [Sporomusaceae bacterium]|nr:TIGR04086 family membrane protein [Sporomusaceae bacterium]
PKNVTRKKVKGEGIMAKFYRKGAVVAEPKSPAEYCAVILKGVALSIIVSLICAFFLSLLTFMSDVSALDNYLEYIMIGVTLMGIFIGSVYAAKKISGKSPPVLVRGLLVGVSIGIIYALFSVGISSDLGQNQILLPVLGNKVAAGSLAGALGGFIGINL